MALNSVNFMITNNMLCSKKLLGGSENMMPKALQQMLTMDAMADLTPGGENLPKIDSYAYDNGKHIILKFKTFFHLHVRMNTLMGELKGNAKET